MGNYDGIKTDVTIVLTVKGGNAESATISFEPNVTPGGIHAGIKSVADYYGWTVTVNKKYEHLLRIEGPGKLPLKSLTWITTSKWTPTIRPVYPKTEKKPIDNAK